MTSRISGVSKPAYQPAINKGVLLTADIFFFSFSLQLHALQIDGSRVDSTSGLAQIYYVKQSTYW